MPSGFHNWSQTSATNATADSAINWAEGQAPSSVNDSSRAGMAVLAKWRDDNNGSLTTGGTSTAYTLTTNTVFSSLALMANQTIGFTVNATCGAAPTLNVDGLGAKTIRTATGVELVAGALVAGGYYTAHYNNSDGIWYLNSPLGAFGPLTITGTLGVSGNFAVNINKFTVTAASGNTLVAGTFDATGAGAFASTLSATGNFAINTNKFNITAASGNTTIAGTLGVTGAVSASSSVLSSSATAGIGYATGAGGTVTQATSKSTGVTLNKISGQITMNGATLAANDRVAFTLTNSTIAATDTIVVNISSGVAGTSNHYVVSVHDISAGSCRISLINTAGGAFGEAVVLNFAVIKAVTA